MPCVDKCSFRNCHHQIYPNWSQQKQQNWRLGGILTTALWNTSGRVIPRGRITWTSPLSMFGALCPIELVHWMQLVVGILKFKNIIILFVYLGFIPYTSVGMLRFKISPAGWGEAGSAAHWCLPMTNLKQHTMSVCTNSSPPPLIISSLDHLFK